MSNVGAFKMFVPPLAFGKAMLVDAAGRRFTNELWYHGRIGSAMRDLPGGRASLIFDSEIAREARAELPDLPLFSSFPARFWLARAKKADNIADLAEKLRFDPKVLQSSVDEIDAIAAGAPDRFHKSADTVAPLRTPPFLGIDLSLTAPPWPALSFSLGGLVVDGDTGAVLDKNDRPIAGLYAAGRAAVGLCSDSYVSGLSLADCVFAGRRAGASAAGGQVGA
jgi:3-oxo-5alpha-steroid 4-dehydrogenase